MPFAAAYAVCLVAFVAMDAVWLTLTSRRLYRPIIGELLSGQVSLAPGVIFYLLYVAGVVFLAVAPGLRTGSWPRAAWSGAALGLVAYGTYDLTNQATLRIWAVRLTLADMAWGTFAAALVATAGYFTASAVTHSLRQAHP